MTTQLQRAIMIPKLPQSSSPHEPLRAPWSASGDLLATGNPHQGPREVLSAMSSIFAAMMKSFSCKPLIFLVWRDTVA